MVFPLIAAAVGLVAAGTAVSIFGASKANEANKEAILIQQQQEAVRRQAMELDASRRQLENIRTVQRARAQALATATHQGAGLGSGLQGGFAQVFGQGAWNATGIAQNLQLGRNMFDLNAQLSEVKMQQSDAGMISQIGSGLTSLGGSLFGSAGAFGRLTSGPSNG